MYTLLNEKDAVEWIRSHDTYEECKQITIDYGIQKGYIFPLPGNSEFYLTAWTYDYLNNQIHYIDMVEKIPDNFVKEHEFTYNYLYTYHIDKDMDTLICDEIKF